MSKYDPRLLGAKCDTCALGSKGWIRNGCSIDDTGEPVEGKGNFELWEQWAPVSSEDFNKEPIPGFAANICAVGALPGEEEVREGRPFVGKSGAELNRGMQAAGLFRRHVSLINEIDCKPPGLATGAYERVSSKIDGARRKLRDYLVQAGLKKADASDKARSKYPHPTDSCRPRLMKELEAYDCIVTLGGTATTAVTGSRAAITSVAGDAHVIELNGRQVRHIATYHPSFVLQAPGHREEFINHLGRALRFFTTGLNWAPFNARLAESPEDLKAWFALMRKRGVPFFAVDCETSKDDPIRARIDLIQFGTDDVMGPKEAGRILYPAEAIAVRFVSVEDGSAIPSWLMEEYVNVFRPILEDRTICKVGHNILGFDLVVFLHTWGIKMRGVLDTIFLARTAWPDQRKGLKPVGRRVTDVGRWEQENAKRD